jgi:hypothetical protein
MWIVESDRVFSCWTNILSHSSSLHGCLELGLNFEHKPSNLKIPNLFILFYFFSSQLIQPTSLYHLHPRSVHPFFFFCFFFILTAKGIKIQNSQTTDNLIPTHIPVLLGQDHPISQREGERERERVVLVNGRGDHCSGRDQNDVVSDSNTNFLATFEPASPLGRPRLRSRPVSQALHHLVPTISLSLSISTFFVSNFGNLLVGLQF